MSDQEALETIDRLCGDDFCEDMGMRDLPESDLKTAINKLLTIYRVAHSMVTSNTCYQRHSAWRDEAEKLRAQLKIEGL